MIEKEHPNISISRQADLSGVSRSSVYYEPAQASEKDKQIMDLIDIIFTESPFYGSRRIMAELKYTYKIDIGRDHTRTLMGIMGIEAIYPKKKQNTSNSDQNRQAYPYLLKGLEIIRPNQVWSIDITYIRLADGFCYLVAIIDWHSRYVISWKLSNTLEIGFCLDALDEALEKSIPEIFNSDQGCHFTSPIFTGRLLDKNVLISMDGRGRCLDNIFVERLWRAVKYENIFINSYNSVSEVRSGLNDYFCFYNNKRRHQSLDYRVPAEIYFKQL